MNLSKEMALILHRMMWSDMQKELGDNPSRDARNKFKTDWIQRMFPDEYISNHCFLCEYAGTAGCSKCPIDWGNERVSPWLAKCTGDNTDYLTSPISEILALPEKGKEGAKNRVEIDLEAFADNSYIMVKNTLADSSGLPKEAPTACHIQAIEQNAIYEYIKNNPAKAVKAIDVDEAFEQYAKEQTASILEALADRSFLDPDCSVTMHLDEIERLAANMREQEVTEKFKKKLSAFSKLPKTAGTIEHIIAIKKKAVTNLEEDDLVRKAADLGEDAERDRITKWLSVYSGLPAAKEVHEHVSAIIDNNYDKGRKDLLEEMRKRVEG